MKKAIIAVFSIATVLLSVNYVFAEDEIEDDRFAPHVTINQKAEKEERQILLNQVKEKVKLKIEDKKASVSAKLTEKKKNLITEYWQKLSKRLAAAIDRLDILTQRIENRLKTIETNNPGKDTASIHSQINDAKKKLADAKTKLSSLNAVITDAIDSQSPKDAFDVVRSSVKEIKTELMDVHKILVHVIGDIKGLHVGDEDLNKDDEKPTTTLTVTPTVTMTPTLTPTLTLTPTPSPVVTPTI